MSGWLLALVLFVAGDNPDARAAYAAWVAKAEQIFAVIVATSEPARIAEPTFQTLPTNVSPGPALAEGVIAAEHLVSEGMAAYRAAMYDVTPSEAEPRDPALAPLISEASSRFDLPEPWIRAVMQVESNEQTDVTSPKGAMGLMQLMPATYAYLSDRYGLGDDPYVARDNILAGSAYLRELYDRYGTEGFLAAYNAGPGRYEDSLCRRCSLPEETERYVAAVRLAVGEALFAHPNSRFYQPIAIAPDGALTLARSGEPMPTGERLALHSLIEQAVRQASAK
jgi:soluble lytic murein transglycosylase-like protein